MAKNIDDFVTPDEHALIDHTGLPGVGGGGITGIEAQNNGGALQGPQPTLNFIPSGGAGVSVVEDVGNNRIDITISAPTASTLNNLYSGVANGFSLGSGGGASSGSTNVANVGNPIGWGICFSVGSSGAAAGMIAFGTAKGTGSNQGQISLLPGGGLDNTNGILWNTSNGSGFTSSFGGSTWTISYNYSSAAVTGHCATSLSWS